MKRPPSWGPVNAFTLLELLGIVALVAVLVALTLPVRRSTHVKAMLDCNHNLREIGTALWFFAGDHDDHFPPEVAVTNGGSMELIGTGNPALHFQTLSNYTSGNWYAFHCPGDHPGQPATNRVGLPAGSVSYFLSMNAKPGPATVFLAGDRNLELAGRPVPPGLFTLLSNANVGWTRE